MNHSSYFVALLTDEVIWEHLQVLLQEYDPEVAAKHIAYLSALDELTAGGGDAQALDAAYRSAIISDALFAFQKGMEANLYHFRNPYVSSFTQVDFDNLHQEPVMMAMPKRAAAEKVIDAIRTAFFQDGAAWCEAINEYIIDLEVILPKLMHFEGYLAGNSWFHMTIPGYQEDHALTSIYQMQINQYFGK